MTDGDLKIFNGIACVFWSGFLIASIYRQKVRYSRNGSVLRSQSPRAYWLSIGIIAIAVVWTGIAFVLHRT